jgi:hypothetical protein
MEYIRKTYRVPAKRGMRIEFSGNPHRGKLLGTIVGEANQYLRVKIDGEDRTWTLHPTWEMRYIDA